MRLKKSFIYIISTSLLCLVFLYFKNRRSISNSIHDASESNSFHLNETNSYFRRLDKIQSEIVIVAVSCGMRQQETLNLIKSAIIFSFEHPLKIIIITENDLMTGFREKLDDWTNLATTKFTYEILPLTFPKENEAEWRNLFKPCAAQRLFLPAILTNVDSVLYLDTDTIFISPPYDTWTFFNKFNSSQIAAVSPEHEDPNVGWYNRFSKHPYYGKLGINSGVMLMNLTRMRQFEWNLYMLPLYKEYKLKITWGDQDLINILFAYNPDKLYVFPCQYNYRPDHCMYMSVCNAPKGIQILHGNRGYFHSEKQPVFSTIYSIIEEYQLGTDVYRNLVVPLESALSTDFIKNTNCGKISDKFLTKFKESFKENTEYYENS